MEVKFAFAFTLIAVGIFCCIIYCCSMIKYRKVFNMDNIHEFAINALKITGILGGLLFWIFRWCRATTSARRNELMSSDIEANALSISNNSSSPFPKGNINMENISMDKNRNKICEKLCLRCTYEKSSVPVEYFETESEIRYENDLVPFAKKAEPLSVDNISISPGQVKIANENMKTFKHTFSRNSEKYCCVSNKDKSAENFERVIPIENYQHCVN